MNAVFMVESVMAVAKPSCLTRERREDAQAKDRRRKGHNLFADILNTAAEDVQEAPAQFQTSVYGRDCKMTTIEYQTREYRC